MTTTGDQSQPGTGQGTPSGVIPSGEPGAAGVGAPSLSTDVLEAIRQSQRETLQAIQRDINGLKSGFDRNMHQLREHVDERLTSAAPSHDKDILAMLNSPHIDEAEKNRLRGELTQRDIDSERQARQKAEREAAYHKELLEATITVNNTFSAWGMSGQEEGIYRPEAGDSPRDAAMRIIASIPQAKINAQRQAAQAASASSQSHPVQAVQPTSGAPRLDVSAPSGAAPTSEALESWATMNPQQRDVVMKRIRKANAAGQPIGIREAVMGS